jgi:hypothetical protein
MAHELALLLLFQTRIAAPTRAQLREWLTRIGPVEERDGAFYVAESDAEGAPTARVTLDDGAHVLAQSLGIAEELAADHPAYPAITRCDARIEVAWDPEDGEHLTDVSLELCYLESDLKGITVYLNLDEVSEGSFPHGAELARAGEDDDDDLRSALVGSWRLDPARSSPQAEPPLSATFTATGDLVYSRKVEGGLARILLTYRVEEGTLVTDQPSRPQEQRTPLTWLPGGELSLCDFGGRCVFTRETAGAHIDPDAALYALAGFALRHGVGSTGAEGPMTPFILTEEATGRRALTRIAGATAKGAEETARQVAAESSLDTLLCAYACDGYIVDDGERTDAIIVEASRRGRDGALVLAQAYRPGPDGSESLGAMVSMADAPSWFVSN